MCCSTAALALANTSSPSLVMMMSTRRRSVGHSWRVTKPLPFSLSTRRLALLILSSIRSVSNFTVLGLPARPLRMRRILNCCKLKPKGFKVLTVRSLIQLEV